MVKREEKATRREILAFIRQSEVIDYKDLMNQFGYAKEGAATRIHRLRRMRCVEPVGRVPGRYGLTEHGERRLAYYEQRERERLAAGE
jgi:predicted ArsR family transcriptional regulator